VTEIHSESEFTHPSAWCPDPGLWHAADGDSAELEVTALVASFIRALKPESVIETGTAFGQTAEAIGLALRDNGRGWLVTLEPDQERARISRERCMNLPVTIEEVQSLEFTPSAPVDFLWLDSLLHLRVSELRRFRPYASSGCVVGFHDTGPLHGLRPHVDQLWSEGLITQPLYLRTPRGVCFTGIGD